MKIDQASTPPRVRYAGYQSLVLLLAALVCDAGLAAAQSTDCPLGVTTTMDLADVWSIRMRASQLIAGGPTGSLTIRRPSFERKAADCRTQRDTTTGLSVELLPLRGRTLYNSAYPLDINSGTVWAGRGINAVAELGGSLRYGPLTITAYPSIAYQENRAFKTRAPLQESASPFAYAGHAIIDWPQRHGDESFSTIHPGQSSIQLAHNGFALGVSTENLWIGPAQRMPLLMSPTAPGFPHAFLATERAVDVGIGNLEAQLFWGRIEESDYFDADDSNDRTLVVGTTATFELAYVRGLHVGVHRSFLVGYDQPDWSITDYLGQPFVGLTDNPPGDNKLLSIFARWVLTGAEFEAYAEWAREDGWGPLVDLLREPNHSQAYMLGFQKLGRWGDARLRWWGELAHLEHSMSVRSARGAVSFYTHSTLKQGYTNRGQLLGSWTGPGSDSQILGVDRIDGKRMTGVAIERVRFDADAYYNQWARFYAHNGHDVSLSLWLRHSDAITDDLRLSVTGAVARRQNRNFVYFTGDQPPELRWETNAHIDLEVRWLPSLSGQR